MSAGSPTRAVSEVARGDLGSDAPRDAEVEGDTRELADGVRSGDRAALARAITLVESRRRQHMVRGQALLAALMPEREDTLRVAISGVPGAGKSTLIEALGTRLTAAGRRVAVLAVDPSSGVTGGSILGDKTRMQRLANDPLAFVRPSPSGGTLGGVARRTREAMLLCEAAGFETVLVETVGVGQSEATAAEMVDTFVMLMLAGAGDELQGIKRGAMELAHVVAVNKADGANRAPAERAAAGLATALRWLVPDRGGWVPPVIACSAEEGRGIDDIWSAVERYRESARSDGTWSARRRDQRVRWLWKALDELMTERLRSDPRIAAQLDRAETEVREGRQPPTGAALDLLAAFAGSEGTPKPSGGR